MKSFNQYLINESTKKWNDPKKEYFKFTVPRGKQKGKTFKVSLFDYMKVYDGDRDFMMREVGKKEFKLRSDRIISFLDVEFPNTNQYQMGVEAWDLIKVNGDGIWSNKSDKGWWLAVEVIRPNNGHRKGKIRVVASKLESKFVSWEPPTESGYLYDGKLDVYKGRNIDEFDGYSDISDVVSHRHNVKKWVQVMKKNFKDTGSYVG